MVGRISSVSLLWCDDVDTRRNRVRKTLKPFNLEQLLGHMQVELGLVVIKDNLVVIMDPVTFELVFETTEGLKYHIFGSIDRQFNFIARVVLIGAETSSLDKAAGIDMQKLDLVTILDEFSQAHFEAFLVRRFFFFQFSLETLEFLDEVFSVLLHTSIHGSLVLGLL